MSQLGNAMLIVQRSREACARRKLAGGTALGVGLVCNAWAESRLHPDAVGDGGASIGLFQLNTRAGLGLKAMQDGYSRAALFEPEVNIRVMLDACLSERHVLAAMSNGTLYDVTWAIVQYVERPADIPGQVAARTGLIASISGLDPHTRATDVA